MEALLDGAENLTLVWGPIFINRKKELWRLWYRERRASNHRALQAKAASLEWNVLDRTFELKEWQTGAESSFSGQVQDSVKFLLTLWSHAGAALHCAFCPFAFYTHHLHAVTGCLLV